jgi:hypothetical protein
MAAGTVQLYNTAYETLFQDATRQWDDATAGNIMWMLADDSYTPADTHATTTNVTNQVITGDAVPINATNLVVTDTPGTAAQTFFQAGCSTGATEVSWGTAVDISARWLICVQPVAAGTFSATTSKLIFYVDLNTATGNLTSTSGEFTINMPSDGWFYISQA